MSYKRVSKTLDSIRSYMLPHNQIYNLGQRDMIAKVSKREEKTCGTQTELMESLKNRYSLRSLNEREKYIAEMQNQICQLEKEKSLFSAELEAKEQRDSLKIKELFIAQDAPPIVLQESRESRSFAGQAAASLAGQRLPKPLKAAPFNAQNSQNISQETSQEAKTSQKIQGNNKQCLQKLIDNIDKAENHREYSNQTFNSQVQGSNAFQMKRLSGLQKQNTCTREQKDELIMHSFPINNNNNSAITQPKILKGQTCFNSSLDDSFIDNASIQYYEKGNDQSLIKKTSQNIQQQLQSPQSSIVMINNANNSYSLNQNNNLLNPISISSDRWPSIQTRSQQIHHNQHQKDLLIQFEPQIEKFYIMKSENNMLDLQNRALSRCNIKKQQINIQFDKYLYQIESKKYGICALLSDSQNSSQKKKNKKHSQLQSQSKIIKDLLLQIYPKIFNIPLATLGQNSLLDDETLNMIGSYISIVHNSQITWMLEQLLMTQNGKEAALQYAKANKLCFYLDSQAKDSHAILLQQSQKYQRLIQIIHQQLTTAPEVAQQLCQQIDIYAFLCQNKHWIGFCYAGETTYYFDGLNLSNMKFETLNNFLRLIQGNTLFKYKRFEIPKQKNSHDCGIYCLLTMLLKTLIRNKVDVYMYGSVFREWIIKSVLLFGQ